MESDSCVASRSRRARHRDTHRIFVVALTTAAGAGSATDPSRRGPRAFWSGWCFDCSGSEAAWSSPARDVPRLRRIGASARDTVAQALSARLDRVPYCGDRGVEPHMRPASRARFPRRHCPSPSQRCARREVSVQQSCRAVGWSNGEVSVRWKTRREEESNSAGSGVSPRARYGSFGPGHQAGRDW